MKSAQGFGTARLAASLNRCREADRQMKSSAVAGFIPIERLICTMPRAGVKKSSEGR